MLKGQRAISPVLATLLLVLITFAVGILLYAFVSGTVMNLTSNKSTQQPFSLLIENLRINNACITVYVKNSRNQARALIERAYVNGESHGIFNAVNNKVVIPQNSLAPVYILGSYTRGTLYEIKLILSSGSSLTTMKRY